jgi:hypothetical protein
LIFALGELVAELDVEPGGRPRRAATTSLGRRRRDRRRTPPFALVFRNWRAVLADDRFNLLKLELRLPYAVERGFEPGLWRPGDIKTTAEETVRSPGSCATSARRSASWPDTVEASGSAVPVLEWARVLRGWGTIP